MHMMYVDESGDPGYGPGTSARYIRVGVVVHGWKWAAIDDRVLAFKRTRGLDWRDEIRASDLRRGKSAFAQMARPEREVFLGDFLDTIRREMPELVVLAVCINKHRVDTARKERLSNPVVRSMEMLLEQFNKYLATQKDRCGIVVLDECEARNDANIRYFQNYLRHFSEQIDPRRIVEGTLFLPSHSSNLLQIADVCANVFFRRYRWEEAATKEWVRIEEKFVDIREWPNATQ